MITLDHEVLCSDEQMEFIIEGMRNPMNSWEKSDSHPGCFYYDGDEKDCDDCAHIAPNECDWRPYYILGKNDMELMTKLAKAGKDHRKYMRMIPVMIRITAPLYWWKEFDTYKIGTVANSTSTMHKITAKKFTREDFSTDMLTTRSLVLLDNIIDLLNYYRGMYLNGGDDYYCDNDSVIYKPKDKRIWYQLIQMLPDSYNQTRNVFFNYEVLANIYQGRRNHKLNEWHVVCDWIERLPHSHLITGKEPKTSLEIDAVIAGKGYLHGAIPTSSPAATDTIQSETVDSLPKTKLMPGNKNGLNDPQVQFKCTIYDSPQINELAKNLLDKNRNLMTETDSNSKFQVFSKAKPAPADFENIPDDIEDQEKPIDEGFVRDMLKYTAEKLSAETDMKVLDFLKEPEKSIGEAYSNIASKAIEAINDAAEKKMWENIPEEFLDSKPKDSLVAAAIASDIIRGDTFGKVDDDKREVYSDVITECENITLRPDIANMTISDIYKNFRLHNEDSDNDKPQGDSNC